MNHGSADAPVEIAVEQATEVNGVKMQEPDGGGITHRDLAEDRPLPWTIPPSNPPH